MELIIDSLNQATNLLNKFIADEDNIAKIKEAGDVILESFKKGGKVMSCGNGGSLCDAMHFAEELTGRFRHNRIALPAIAISDPSHITCVGNDFGFDYIFSKYLEAHAKNEDVLFAISTSGNSKNIIEAIHFAKEIGIKVIALTGKKGGEAGSMANVEIRVPWEEYSDRIQEIHIKIIHILIEYIESKL